MSTPQTLFTLFCSLFVKLTPFFDHWMNFLNKFVYLSIFTCCFLNYDYLLFFQMITKTQWCKFSVLSKTKNLRKKKYLIREASRKWKKNERNFCLENSRKSPTRRHEKRKQSINQPKLWIQWNEKKLQTKNMQMAQLFFMYYYIHLK